MLSNAYFLAKIRFDTAENGPATNLQNFRKMHFRKMHFKSEDSARTLRRSASKRCAPAAARARATAFSKMHFSKMHFSKNAFFENFANFCRARSRLYQNEILQENMRSTAFFKLYKICILLHRCNLNFFAKNRFEKLRISQNFRKFSQMMANSTFFFEKM